MSENQIKRLMVSRIPLSFSYEHSDGKPEVRLEGPKEDGNYYVRLPAGCYDHNGAETGEGSVLIEIYGKHSMAGRIVRTDPPFLNELEKHPIDLVLSISDTN